MREENYHLAWLGYYSSRQFLPKLNKDSDRFYRGKAAKSTANFQLLSFGEWKNFKIRASRAFFFVYFKKKKSELSTLFDSHTDSGPSHLKKL